MKLINFIGILLILLTSTIGNKIAPGRYCTFYENDTVTAFGPTKYAENDKYGFWILFGKLLPQHDINLYAVGKFENNRLNGTWIEFQGDSLQTRAIESYYINDSLNGHFYDYDTLGILCTKRYYKNDECDSGIVFENSRYLWQDSYDFGFVDLNIRTTILNDMSKPNYTHQQFITFNSWTNKITTINILMCSILLLLNILNFIKHGKHKK
ncbi:MAG: hypothetical protein IKO99_10800 [Bacteroidales bacterium]|nr:hypothetical protein [Bacteroidales bacterium]